MQEYHVATGVMQDTSQSCITWGENDWVSSQGYKPVEQPWKSHV